MHVMSTAQWRRLVEALAAIEPDELQGGIENQVKLTLAEIGFVVPASCIADMAGDEPEAP